MIFRIELIKNRKYIPVARRINQMVQDNATKVFRLPGHQYEWAKNELNAWESEPGMFEHWGIRFVKQVRRLK